MAAAAGLLDLNEPMFGLSKVEVVQSIDPTKLQVSLDDCDLLSMRQAQQHLLNRLAGLAAGRLTLLVGNIALQHPVASSSCPPSTRMQERHGRRLHAHEQGPLLQATLKWIIDEVQAQKAGKEGQQDPAELAKQVAQLQEQNRKAASDQVATLSCLAVSAGCIDCPL